MINQPINPFTIIVTTIGLLSNLFIIFNMLRILANKTKTVILDFIVLTTLSSAVFEFPKMNFYPAINVDDRWEFSILLACLMYNVAIVAWVYLNYTKRSFGISD